MSGRTPNFSLSTIGPGEHLSDDSYKFTKADRELMDRLLAIGARDHHHDGAAAGSDAPDTALDLDLQTSGGTLPAGTRVYYKYSLVDANGLETLPSPEAYVDTPAALATPASPTAAYDTVGGTLIAGQYWYLITAYVTAITQETLGSTPVAISIPVGVSTNRVTLTLPSLPAGATGFNIYRRKPGGNQYYYIASATAAGSWVDNGIPDDCNRIPPATNTTNALNSVDITLPEAVPDGYTWRLYRTFVNGSYDRSLLHWVVEETFEGSGIIVDEYTDIGEGTSEGRPSEANQAIASPSKIDLEDSNEVQGHLPLSRVSAFPMDKEFNYPGTLTVVTGTNVWVCPYPQARVMTVVAHIGGTVPAGASVIVDVNKGTGATPTFTTIFTTQANRPTIAAGARRSSVMTPDVQELVLGDSLTVDIDQVGSSTAGSDLVVIILIYAYGWTASESVDWA